MREEPRISLTEFVDVVSSSGTSKAAKIRRMKRADYSVAGDFYKPIREHIVNIHRRSLPKASIQTIYRQIDDQKKINNYSDVTRGYSKWWGRKALYWFDPSLSTFRRHGVEVNINPELGLEINGNPHLVKLYFKADPLARGRAEIILHLMNITLTRLYNDNAPAVALLDIRNSKLITATPNNPNIDAALDAEMAYISAIWPQV